MPTVTIELPARLLAALQRSPDEVKAIEKEVLLAAAIDWYRRGLISQGRAAEIAGIPRAEFIDALDARQIEVVQIDLASLDRDIERA
jgi:predicted HTH domain antitoxin